MLPNVQAAKDAVGSACREVRGTELCLLAIWTRQMLGAMAQSAMWRSITGSAERSDMLGAEHIQGYLTPPSSNEETGTQHAQACSRLTHWF